jgi:hypothetical protein
VKVGDLVRNAYDELGLVVSEPRTATDRDIINLGVFEGDVYEVIDVLMSWGKGLFILDELEPINESR